MLCLLEQQHKRLMLCSINHFMLNFNCGLKREKKREGEEISNIHYQIKDDFYDVAFIYFYEMILQKPHILKQNISIKT